MLYTSYVSRTLLSQPQRKSFENDVEESKGCSSPSTVENTKKPSAMKSAGSGQKRHATEAPSSGKKSKKKRQDSDSPVANKKKVASPSKASANLLAKFLIKGKLGEEKASQKEATEATVVETPAN